MHISYDSLELFPLCWEDNHRLGYVLLKFTDSWGESKIHRDVIYPGQ